MNEYLKRNEKEKRNLINNLRIMFKEEGFGEKSRINRKRGITSDGSGMIFVSVCEEMMSLSSFGG